MYECPTRDMNEYHESFLCLHRNNTIKNARAKLIRELSNFVHYKAPQTLKQCYD